MKHFQPEPCWRESVAMWEAGPSSQQLWLTDEGWEQWSSKTSSEHDLFSYFCETLNPEQINNFFTHSCFLCVTFLWSLFLVLPCKKTKELLHHQVAIGKPMHMAGYNVIEGWLWTFTRLCQTDTYYVLTEQVIELFPDTIVGNVDIAPFFLAVNSKIAILQQMSYCCFNLWGYSPSSVILLRQT